MDLGPIPPEPFAAFIADRFAATGRTAGPAVVGTILAMTGGHPYATQELCYFLWQETRAGAAAGEAQVQSALERLLRSEHGHFSLIWQRASTAERRVLQALAARGRPGVRDRVPPPPRPALPRRHPAGGRGAGA